MITYNSIQNLIEASYEEKKSVSELVLKDQAEKMQIETAEIYQQMETRLSVMMEAVEKGEKRETLSFSGLSGTDAKKISEYMKHNSTICGAAVCTAMKKALAVAEVNASMGKICAAPTAGSSGIVPAVLLTAMEEKSIPKEKIVKSMFTASAIGMVIAKRASISGAEGGCQAECGSGAAMAAGALVELMGGSAEMIGHACAISIKSVLGLVCDPVAGLVEVPCVKRNVMGAVNAMTAAELALAGIESKIPVDEVIDAMKQVGDLLPTSLKETAKGGLAVSKSGIAIKETLK